LEAINFWASLLTFFRTVKFLQLIFAGGSGLAVIDGISVSDVFYTPERIAFFILKMVCLRERSPFMIGSCGAAGQAYCGYPFLTLVLEASSALRWCFPVSPAFPEIHNLFLSRH
jgi:hypothetical protein